MSWAYLDQVQILMIFLIGAGAGIAGLYLINATAEALAERRRNVRRRAASAFESGYEQALADLAAEAGLATSMSAPAKRARAKINAGAALAA